MIRVFIGIELDNDGKEQIASQVKRLQKEFPRLKWVQQENYHLTLKFLGDVEERKIEVLKKNLQKATIGLKPISITLHGLGAFPKVQNPRVLWIGVREGASSLKRLHRSMEEGLRELGFPKEEKSYHPHLTLARCRKSIPAGLTEGILRFSMDELTFNADHITLFKSRLTPRGPLYTKLQSIGLEGIKE